MGPRFFKRRARLRPLTSTAGALALAVAMAAPAATAAHAATTSTSPTSASSFLTDDQAMAQAVSTGKSVVAGADTTPTSTVTANPDGTLTLTQNVAPVRAWSGGQWVGLDPTLVRNADGSLSPKVTSSPLTLSGGGSGPLAVMKGSGGTLSVSLPSGFTLSSPTLSGAVATYDSVLPGVDLIVTADDSGGFSEVLRVNNATAAGNPDLSTLKLTTQASGLTLSSDAAGDLAAKNRDGDTVFTAPTATMWDSASAPPGTPQTTDPTTDQAVDADTGAPLTSGPDAPGPGAHIASLQASYQSGVVTLTPDQSVLDGSSTVYPVYIDPSWSGQTDTVQAWAYVDSEWPGTSFYDPGASTPGPLHVGYTDWTSDVSTNRSFFQTSVHSALWGATVQSSNISFYENWSASCTAEPVDLYWTGTVSSSTTWNNQPSWISKLGSDDVAHGWSTSCGPADVTFDITSLMQTAAGKHWTNATFGLRADDESNDLAWKQFSKQATITTTYDHAPSTPSTLSTSPATSCTASTPTVLGLGDVQLRAAVSDPDGTIDPLTATFTLTDTATSKSYTQSVSATSGTTAAASFSHTSSSWPLASTTSPTKFTWNVKVSDGILTGGTSTTCAFTYDPTAPGAPTITPVGTTTSSGGTSECDDLASDPTNSTCTVGTAAKFTLTDTNTNSGGTVSSYRWQLNDATPQTATAGTDSTYTATLSLKPTEQTNTLVVTALSAGGNLGTPQIFRFIANAPATANDGDLTGDGHPDLVIPGAQDTLPAGLWLAPGTASGVLDTAARNIGAEGNGVSTTQAASSYTGSQVLTGHFMTGAGFNDFLDYTYNTSTGAVSAEILGGPGDGTPLNPVDSMPVTNASGVFSLGVTTANPDGTTSQSTSYATSIANGGTLDNTVMNTLSPGFGSNPFPDLLLVINGSLYDEGANNLHGSYPGAQSASDLADYNPYCLAQNAADNNTACTTGWNTWTITSALVNGLPALFARDTSTSASDPSAGQLWYLSSNAMTTLLSDCLSNGVTDTAYIAAQAAANSWDATSKPTIQAAHVSTDGTQGTLWSVSSTGTVTPYTATLSDTSAAVTAGTSQSLTAETHGWALDDYDTTALTASDDTGSLTLTGTSGVATSDQGPYGSDVVLTGSNYLHSSTAAVTTNKSFTVSAWALPTTDGGDLLAQSGGTISGFTLGNDAGTGDWTFTMPQSNSDSATQDTARAATVPAQLGAWTHLVATYNASTGRVALYVNGIDSATTTHTTTWSATGDLTIGAGQYNSAITGYFKGHIADVQTWNTALTPVQIANTSGTPGYVMFTPTLNSTATLTDATWTYSSSNPSATIWPGPNSTLPIKSTLTLADGTLKITGPKTWGPVGTNGYASATLAMQADGNLVVYDNDTTLTPANALWAAGTSSHPGAIAFLQPDGNFVVYDTDGTALWNSNTAS
jgi:hypothetical protein